jgi:hypothetical protein
MSQEDQSNPKVNMLTKLFPRLEKIGAIAVFLVLVMKISGFSGISLAILVSLTFLACVYFLGTYVIIDLDNIFGIIAAKASFMSCSISMMGVMFTILKFPGASIMLTTGCFALGLALLLSLIFWLKNKQAAYLPYILRSMVVLFLALCFVL